MPTSFVDLPVEINLQILRECGVNDITCLSLTCKYLYIISTELRTPRISLSNLDARLCRPHSCPNAHERNRSCNILRRHRRVCHIESLAAHEGRPLTVSEKSLPLGVDRNYCQTPNWTPHCECFAVTLYKRLETWMPKGLRYCANCRIFTHRCGHDGRFCAVHVRRARWEFARQEKEQKSWQVTLEPEEDHGESSAKGAATRLADLMLMQLTMERMKREAREEVRKRMDELRIREEQVKKDTAELARKEKALRKMMEDLWRRKDKLKESEDKLRKREDQLKKSEDDFVKNGKVRKDNRHGIDSLRSPTGFKRCQCRDS